MNKNKTTINCNVETCKHNKEKSCNLNELNISCTCNSHECAEKKETICNDFEEK